MNRGYIVLMGVESALIKLDKNKCNSKALLKELKKL